jgi:hypothetical protein
VKVKGKSEGKREKERDPEGERESAIETGSRGSGLEGFAAYVKVLELFDLVAADVQALRGRFELTKLLA